MVNTGQNQRLLEVCVIYENMAKQGTKGGWGRRLEIIRLWMSASSLQ